MKNEGEKGKRDIAFSEELFCCSHSFYFFQCFPAWYLQKLFLTGQSGGQLLRCHLTLILLRLLWRILIWRALVQYYTLQINQSIFLNFQWFLYICLLKYSICFKIISFLSTFSEQNKEELTWSRKEIFNSSRINDIWFSFTLPQIFCPTSILWTYNEK